MPLRRLTRREYLVNAAASAVLLPVYHRREWRSPEATRAWQLARIRALVARAYEQVPLYRERYAAAGIRPEDVRTWDDVGRLPCVTKEDMAAGFPARVVARDMPLEQCLLSTSSGTTGQMLTIAHDADRQWPYVLATQRLLRWAAGGRYPPWYRQAYIYTSPYPVPAGRWIYPLRFIPTTNDPAPMLAALRTYAPHVLTCYPTVLRDLLAADPGLMRGLRLRGVSVSSEVSTQEERDAWGELLGCPVRDEYSSEELTRMAAQCPRARYHLMEDITFLEVLEPGGDRPAAGIGEVVGTELHNRAQPFIRYRQGDLARIGPGGCPCGRPGRLLLEVVGRANDGFATSDGGWLSPGFLLDACYRTLMDAPGLASAYRLVQVTREAAELQVVPGPAWGEGAPDRLAASLARELEGRLAVRAFAVDSLERGAAGKRATIVSLVGSSSRQADPADQNQA